MPSALPTIHPHISKLTDDILWAIFMTNTADPYFMTPYQWLDPTAGFPRPLETARLTSQVCSQWRNIVLNSPSLWGRLVDFVSLNQKSDTWRNEVLRRSGISMLWISAENLSDYTNNTPKDMYLMQQFFFDLCNNHWTRIEKISVALNYDLITEEHMDLMQRASPNLVSFKFRTSDAYGFQTSTFPSPIFSSYPPKLLHFHARGTGSVPRLNWMMNLRELCLDYRYNVNEVLDILQHTKLLESLSLISHVGFELKHRPPQHVHLPRLRRLQMEDCLEYIRYIKTAPGCSFWFRESDSSTELEVLESCRRKISHMLQDHNTYSIPKYLRLYCSRFGFNLKNYSHEGEPYVHRSFRQLEDQHFEFIVSLDRDENPQRVSDVLSLLFETMASPHYSNVIEISLEISLESSLLSGPHVYSAFIQFFAIFTSVECLHSSNDGLGTLLNEGVITANLFPSLRMLKLSGAGSTKKSESNRVERFLISRIEMRAPIKIVDITAFENNIGQDLDFLDQFDGMVVVYGENGIKTEYVCGSGQPELLKFYSRATAASN